MQNKIEQLRKRIGLNREDLAKALKVSRQTISSIETGKKIENENIEIHDERKTILRDKSGRYAYIIGMIVIQEGRILIINVITKKANDLFKHCIIQI